MPSKQNSVLTFICKKGDNMNKIRNPNDWIVNAKERIVYIMGGKCCICGYNKCPSALDLHHIDPDTKEFNVSNLL